MKLNCFDIYPTSLHSFVEEAWEETQEVGVTYLLKKKTHSSPASPSAQ